MLVELVVGSLLCSKTDGDFSSYIQTLFYEHPLNWDTPLIRTLSNAPSVSLLTGFEFPFISLGIAYFTERKTLRKLYPGDLSEESCKYEQFCCILSDCF